MTDTVLEGSVLGGRYRILERLGEGGFAAVYKASDERFQATRLVAIKEMSDENLSPAEREQALADFRHEANLLVRLNHPHLPQVSDFFEEAGKAYLVMEFVEGKTLEQVLDEAHGPLDEGLVMGWALQLCEVLHYLHTRPQPIIFRDLKPSNVMVTQDNQLKLIDFGIARLFKATARRDTTLLGSQGYAPLEQYGRGQSDPRSDIYALGATLYHLLAGCVPADAPSRRINPALFELPRQLNPHLSQETEQIILMAMEQDPEERFQSVEAMQKAILGQAASQVPIAHDVRKMPGNIPSSPPPGLYALPASAPRSLPSQEAAPRVQTELERTVLPLVTAIGSTVYRAIQEHAAASAANKASAVDEPAFSAQSQQAMPSSAQMQVMAPLAPSRQNRASRSILHKERDQRGSLFVDVINRFSALLGLVSTLLFLLLLARFLLTLFQLSLGQFSFWVNELSAPLVTPFGAFLYTVPSSSASYIIDVSTIVAIVVYGIGFALVRGFLKLLIEGRR